MLTKKHLKKGQKKLIKLLSKNKKHAIFAGMGTGKTVIMLTALSKYLAKGKINRVLVVSTKLIAETVWDDEVTQWEHLTHLNVIRIMGTTKQREQVLQSNQNADIYTISVDNINWLIDNMMHNNKGFFDCLVIDESSKFKNPSSKRFKALKGLIPSFKYRYILTGTPTPNGLMGLFSQMLLVDNGKRLGRFITHFRDKYFNSDFMGYNYVIKPNGEKQILKKIKDISKSYTLSKKDTPPLITLYRQGVLPLKNQKEITQLVKDESLQVSEDIMIEGKSASAIGMKVHQLTGGACYYDIDDTTLGYETFNTTKLTLLKEVMEEINTPIVVCYSYKHEKERLLNFLPKSLKVVVPNEEKDAKKLVADWNNNKIDVLLTHPSSIGHGLNLQKGDGHTVIWFSTTWDLEIYQQLNLRLARRGQKNIVRIIHLHTHQYEKRQCQALAKKALLQDNVLKALK